MKMTSVEIDDLRAAIEALLSKPEHAGRREKYREAGMSPMRWRWDVLHASGFDTRPLYRAGLQDSHIDTALRAILGKD